MKISKAFTNTPVLFLLPAVLLNTFVIIAAKKDLLNFDNSLAIVFVTMILMSVMVFRTLALVRIQHKFKFISNFSIAILGALSIASIAIFNNANYAVLMFLPFIWLFMMTLMNGHKN